jgi:hypothetical protein
MQFLAENLFSLRGILHHLRNTHLVGTWRYFHGRKGGRNLESSHLIRKSNVLCVLHLYCLKAPILLVLDTKKVYFILLHV